MTSLIMATEVVVPMAVMVLIGVLVRIMKISDRDTMKRVDNLIFKLTMPMVSFYNLYKTDFSKLDNLGYIVYGVCAMMLLFFCAMWIVPKFVHPRPTASAYGQTIFRSNYLIFGTAVAEGIYGAGNIGLVSLLGAVAVPLFNVQASVLLEAGRNSIASGKKLALSIAKNPTVIATVLGLAVNFSGVTLHPLALDVVQDIAGLTTPLSFLSIGVSLNLATVSGKKGYLVSALALRPVLIPAVFVALGVLLGFRGQEMCALMILFAAPVAVSSYPMAVAMGADGDFAGQMVALSTVFCLPTIFLWTLILNSLQFI